MARTVIALTVLVAWTTAVVVCATQARSGPAAWEVIPSGTTESIRMVRLDPVAGDLWLLTATKILHRLANGSWGAPLAVPQEPDGLASFYPVRPGLVYAVTPGVATVVMHRDGAWSTIGKLGRCISHDLPIVAAGNRILAGCPYYSGFVDFDADAPATFGERHVLAVREIAVIGPNEVLTASVSELTLVRLDDPKTVHLPSEGLKDLLWADRSHVITGMGGTFYHAQWDPAGGTVGAWTKRDVPGTDVHLNEMWGPSVDNLLAVGRRGTIARFDGSAWSVEASPTTVDLLSIAGGTSGVWIGGAAGTLLHRPAVR